MLYVHYSMIYMYLASVQKVTNSLLHDIKTKIQSVKQLKRNVIDKKNPKSSLKAMQSVWWV